MPRKHQYYGGIIGGSPLDGSAPRTSGVFNLGALSGDGATDGDDHWDNVTLLVDNTSVTTDLSTNNHSGISVAVGTVSTGTTNGSSVPHPYGSTGVPYLDFSSARVELPSSVDLSGGDWTIETWAWFDTIVEYQSLFSSPDGGWQLDFDASAQLRFNATTALTKTGALSTSTWYFVSLSYVASTQTLYLGVDGTVVSSSSTDFATMTADYMGGTGNDIIRIGQNRSNQYRVPHDGKMSDIRFTAGVARYTSNFSKPTAAPATNAPVTTTRPTRRWGGMTGRSLVESTVVPNPWTPSDVTNTASPTIWLDADAGLTTNQGSLSTTVTLGSGAWSSSSVQNGLTTAINSAGGSVVPISFSSTSVQSIAMLYKWDSAGSTRSYGTTFSGSSDYRFMGGINSAVLHSYQGTDSHLWDHVREDGTEYSATHTTAGDFGTRDADWVLHVFVLDGTKVAAIDRWGYERVYPNRHFTGELAEIMAFPGKLSQSECEQVEGYLAHKWGLESLLPSAHSYKSAAPTSGPGSTTTNVPTTGVLSLPELLQASYGTAASAAIDVLVVGAGSARTLLLSSQHYASGGNGGSIVRRTSFAVSAGTNYAVTVGTGATSIDGASSATESVGADGGSTSFGSLTAAGGVAQQANHDAHSYAAKTSADLDGTVTNYSAVGGTGGYPGASGAGAGGSATTNVGGAAYSYAVNGATVNANISAGGNWNTSATQASSVSGGVPYGRGGEGGYNVPSPGGDGVVYVAYPTGTVSSYTWSGAAGDLDVDTATVSGYTILRFTGNGTWTPS